jgi:RND family efflux transporter MFP subunit
MSGRATRLFTVAALGMACCLGGCARGPKEVAAGPPPPVQVSLPVEKSVTDFVDLTGQTSAVESVEVRPRVWGYLQKVNFKEGALVKKDEVLYEIDARTYKAALDEAEGKVALDEANLRFSEADYQRIVEAGKKGAANQQEVDKARASRDAAEASLRTNRATVAQRRLDLDFTKVTAPISGRVSRTLVTVGNLVQGGQTGSTLLTTIVSVDPIYCIVDVDEGTVLRVRRMIREGKAKSAREAALPVNLGLANEEGLPHQGVVDFVDNQINPRTGTLRIRGTFPNADERLAPGYFARVRVPIGFPYKALLVAERAIDTDQGQRIVYVVNEKNEVSARTVRVGQRHQGLRVIESGLTAGERIVVAGIQVVRPGIVVEPKLVEMPSALTNGDANGTAPGPKASSP